MDLDKIELATVDTTTKRENSWFDEHIDAQVLEWLMGWLQGEFIGSAAMWAAVEQEVLIALWLNCPEYDEDIVAALVAQRWLWAERKRQWRTKKRQVPVDEARDFVEHLDYSLESYLGELTDTQQAVAVARYEYGLTEAEVAASLGISQQAVSRTLARVKKALREKLDAKL
jgi:RNA polymerase sigma factor (sigma-70 family)